MTAPDAERLEALLAKATPGDEYSAFEHRMALRREAVAALPTLLAERKDLLARVEALEEALRQVERGGADASTEFVTRQGTRNSPTAFSASTIQEPRAACVDTARATLAGTRS